MIDDGARERNLPGTDLVVLRCRTMPFPVPKGVFLGARNFPASE